MADYTQPPYGMPFPIAPQHHQQSAADPQFHPQVSPSDSHQAPIPEGFHFNGGLPGLNLQSYNQNSQQPQYSYWPPPPPPNLQQNPFGGIIPPSFLTQNGIPIPPPPPPISNSNFFPPVPPMPLQNAVVPSPNNAQTQPSFQSPQPSMAMVNGRVAGVIESDKEEGEVSEGDGASRSTAGHGRSLVEPPRSFPTGHEAGLRKEGKTGGQHQNSGSQAQTPTGPSHAAIEAMHPRPSSAQQKAATPRTFHNMAQKQEEAKNFIKLLYEYNFGYAALVNEGLDAQLLGEMYQGMNLHSQVEATPARTQVATPTSKAIAGVTSVPAHEQTVPSPSVAPSTKANGELAPIKPVTTLKTNVNVTPPAKSAPSPIDRKDYIARLQAAKMGKQSSAVKVTPPAKTPPVAEPDLSITGKVSQPNPITKVAPPNAKAPKSEEEKRRQTEIIKQRLEQMRAEGKLPGSGPSTPQISRTPGATPAPIGSAYPQPVQRNDLASSQAPPVPENNANPVPPFSKLPGLFMNSSSASVAHNPSVNPPPLSTQNSVGTSSRKRPVASDFDEVTTPRSSGPAYTRPLGQSPHEHDAEAMIIEVSEDDSDGSDMELDDDQAILQSSTAFSPSGLARNGSQSLRNLPPLSDFPSRSGSARPFPPAISTPPAARILPNGDTFNPETLSKAEKEILELKLKIAEMSRKKKMTVSKKDAISSPAPSKSDSIPGPLQTEVSVGPSSSIPSSVRFEKSLSHDGPTKGNSATVLGTAAAVGAAELKKQRRAEIESVLRSLNDGLESRKARLAQLEKEMAEISATTRQAEMDRERLIQELESYGVDTEGMPDDQLQAHKEEIEVQKMIVSASQTNDVSAPIAEDIKPSGAVQVTRPAETSHDAVQLSESSTLPKDSDMIFPTAQSPMNSRLRSPVGEELLVSDDEFHPTPASELAAQRAAPPSKVDIPVPVVGPPNVEQGSKKPDITTPVDDEEDFYSPEPSMAPAVELEQETVTKAGVVAKSPSEEGEIEMSESPSASEDEEEYEPEEPHVGASPSIPTPDHQKMDIANSLSSNSSPMSTTEDEGEIYEPPEPVQETPAAQAFPTDASLSDAQPTQEDDQGAMDISVSPSVESDSARQSPSETANLSISFNHATDTSIAIADDLAPQLQAQNVSSMQAPVTDSPSVTEAEADSARFVPYESPLRMFKSYRYHPQFPQDVAGGYLSMTYSHQIDPNKPLCPFESVGGTCNDPQCDGQHFKGMGISGEKLLVQLGTANPGKTPEEKQQWNDGLRLVLKELRQNNIKDPNGIAMEIARYRRQFFNDDTRVVNL